MEEFQAKGDHSVVLQCGRCFLMFKSNDSYMKHPCGKTTLASTFVTDHSPSSKADDAQPTDVPPSSKKVNLTAKPNSSSSTRTDSPAAVVRSSPRKDASSDKSLAGCGDKSNQLHKEKRDIVEFVHLDHSGDNEHSSSHTGIDTSEIKTDRVINMGQFQVKHKLIGAIGAFGNRLQRPKQSVVRAEAKYSVSKKNNEAPNDDSNEPQLVNSESKLKTNINNPAWKDSQVPQVVNSEAQSPKPKVPKKKTILMKMPNPTKTMNNVRTYLGLQSTAKANNGYCIKAPANVATLNAACTSKATDTGANVGSCAVNVIHTVSENDISKARKRIKLEEIDNDSEYQEMETHSEAIQSAHAPDNSTDYIDMETNMSNHTEPSMLSTMGKSIRVLKPNGKVVVITRNSPAAAVKNNSYMEMETDIKPSVDLLKNLASTTGTLNPGDKSVQVSSGSLATGEPEDKVLICVLCSGIFDSRDAYDAHYPDCLKEDALASETAEANKQTKIAWKDDKTSDTPDNSNAACELVLQSLTSIDPLTNTQVICMPSKNLNLQPKLIGVTNPAVNPVPTGAKQAHSNQVPVTNPAKQQVTYPYPIVSPRNTQPRLTTNIVTGAHASNKPFKVICAGNQGKTFSSVTSMLNVAKTGKSVVVQLNDSMVQDKASLARSGQKQVVVVPTANHNACPSNTLDVPNKGYGISVNKPQPKPAGLLTTSNSNVYSRNTSTFPITSSVTILAKSPSSVTTIAKSTNSTQTTTSSISMLKKQPNNEVLMVKISTLPPKGAVSLLTIPQTRMSTPSTTLSPKGAVSLLTTPQTKMSTPSTLTPGVGRGVRPPTARQVYVSPPGATKQFTKHQALVWPAHQVLARPAQHPTCHRFLIPCTVVGASGSASTTNVVSISNTPQAESLIKDSLLKNLPSAASSKQQPGNCATAELHNAPQNAVVKTITFSRNEGVSIKNKTVDDIIAHANQNEGNSLNSFVKSRYSTGPADADISDTIVDYSCTDVDTKVFHNAPQNTVVKTITFSRNEGVSIKNKTVDDIIAHANQNEGNSLKSFVKSRYSTGPADADISDTIVDYSGTDVDTKVFTCTLCNVTFDSIDLYTDHIIQCGGETSHQTSLLRSERNQNLDNSQNSTANSQNSTANSQNSTANSQNSTANSQNSKANSQNSRATLSSDQTNVDSNLRNGLLNHEINMKARNTTRTIVFNRNGSVGVGGFTSNSMPRQGRDVNGCSTSQTSVGSGRYVTVLGGKGRVTPDNATGTRTLKSKQIGTIDNKRGKSHDHSKGSIDTDSEGEFDIIEGEMNLNVADFINLDNQKDKDKLKDKGRVEFNKGECEVKYEIASKNKDEIKTGANRKGENELKKTAELRICHEPNHQDKVEVNEAIGGEVIEDVDIEVKDYMCDFCATGFTDRDEFNEHYSRCMLEPGEERRNIWTQEDEEEVSQSNSKDGELDFSFMVDIKEEAVQVSDENGSEVSEDSDELGEPEIEMDIDIDLLECPNCGEMFDSEERLSEHQEECPVNLDCDVCGLSFEDEEMLADHNCFVESSTGDDNKMYRCVKCSALFTGIELYEGHKKVCGLFKCRLCDQTFKSKDVAKGHECSGRTNFTCGMCAKTFDKRHVLKMHMKIHSNERDFACPECSKTFLHKHQLKNHLNCHSTERKFKCDQCDATYKYYSNLQKHKDTHRERERKYACSFCDHTFFSNYHRNRHELSHAQNPKRSRTHKCEQCQASFARKDSMTEHIKRHHDEGRKQKNVLKCDECDQTFFWKKHYRVHMKEVHDRDEEAEEDDQSEADDNYTSDEAEAGSDAGASGEDNAEEIMENLKKKGQHGCEKCDRVFRTPGNLNRHMKLMHDDESEETDMESE